MYANEILCKPEKQQISYRNCNELCLTLINRGILKNVEAPRVHESTKKCLYQLPVRMHNLGPVKIYNLKILHSDDWHFVYLPSKQLRCTQ